MKDQRGFTLVELLLVVSIIGILAAIAIPQFSAYRNRAYDAEGYLLGGDVVKDIMEFQRHTGRFPENNAEAGLPKPEHIRGKYVSGIAVRKGAIDISFIEGKGKYTVLSARAAVIKDDPTSTLVWIWGDDKVPADMTVLGDNKTKERGR